VNLFALNTEQQPICS